MSFVSFTLLQSFKFRGNAIVGKMIMYLFYFLAAYSAHIEQELKTTVLPVPSCKYQYYIPQIMF